MPLFNWRRVALLPKAMRLRANRDASRRVGVTNPALPRDNKRDGERDQQ
jgi:hypothetical protein